MDIGHATDTPDGTTIMTDFMTGAHQIVANAVLSPKDTKHIKWSTQNTNTQMPNGNNKMSPTKCYWDHNFREQIFRR